MIGRLRGIIVEKKAPSLVLDVGGVGYEINAPMTTFYELPQVGSKVTLYTHFIVREDAQLLFGFVAEKDRTLFRSLIKISGVGGKLALALLSGMSANDFVTTVRNNDANSLTRIPGVGKKTAERLIIEMRDRLKEWQQEATPNMPIMQPAGEDLDLPVDGIKDAVSALIALGFKPPEASRMVSKINSHGLASEEIIRQALQSVAG
ncbi:MAG: Holliday junction branch migration protein RuvA [Gammaproteobacteria bacterium]|nr:Holliday junction branch migration protein RuvA [Gammaproteobacteria bacterium]